MDVPIIDVVWNGLAESREDRRHGGRVRDERRAA